MKLTKPCTLNAAIRGALLAMFAVNAGAAVSPDEAKQLGGPVLSEIGSERAGNKESTIPEWKNERIKAPANWDAKEPNVQPDPFSDKPLFSITDQNMAQYADKLTEAQKAILKKYPGQRFDIYPTRRTFYAPKYVLDNTAKNATSCKGKDASELTLEGCYGGILFPIPKTGIQTVWNHLTRWGVYNGTYVGANVLVTPSGTAVYQGIGNYNFNLPMYDPKRTTPLPSDAVYYRLMNATYAPVRKVGEKIMLQFFMDGRAGGKVWQYLPGQRRVKLSPDLAYDTPNPQSGGAATMDEVNIFYGAPDRYDFKLEGKKEMYFPYNHYTAGNPKVCPMEEKAVKAKGFINPDCMRWELHRAWVVSAKLKPEFRHIYPKRTLYWDEDGFSAGMSDNFDASGKLYRGDFQGYYQVYNDPTNQTTSETSAPYVVDLQTGAWYGQSLKNVEGGGFQQVVPRDDLYYSDTSMAGQGVR